jgi:hypothetical protein
MLVTARFSGRTPQWRSSSSLNRPPMSLWVNRVIANVWQALPLCLRSQTYTTWRAINLHKASAANRDYHSNRGQLLPGHNGSACGYLVIPCVQNHRLALSTAQPHLPLQIHQCHLLSHLGVLPDVEALPASDLCSQATTALM